MPAIADLPPLPRLAATLEADDLLPPCAATLQHVALSAFRLAATADAHVLSDFQFDAPVVVVGGRSRPPLVRLGDPLNPLALRASLRQTPDVYRATHAAAAHAAAAAQLASASAALAANAAAAEAEGDAAFDAGGGGGAPLRTPPLLSPSGAAKQAEIAAHARAALRRHGYPSIATADPGVGGEGEGSATGVVSDGLVYRAAGWARGDEGEHPDLSGAAVLMGMAFSQLPAAEHKALSRLTHERVASVHRSFAQRAAAAQQQQVQQQQRELVAAAAAGGGGDGAGPSAPEPHQPHVQAAQAGASAWTDAGVSPRHYQHQLQSQAQQLLVAQPSYEGGPASGEPRQDAEQEQQGDGEGHPDTHGPAPLSASHASSWPLSHGRQARSGGDSDTADRGGLTPTGTHTGTHTGTGERLMAMLTDLMEPTAAQGGAATAAGGGVRAEERSEAAAAAYPEDPPVSTAEHAEIRSQWAGEAADAAPAASCASSAMAVDATPDASSAPDATGSV
jgi:hypothetical protein